MLQRLRPLPHRGPLIAAGAVALTVAIAVLTDRFDHEWGVGIRFAIELAVAAPLLAMGWLATPTGDRPDPHVAVLLISGLILALGALIGLAEILGAERGIGSSGSTFWVFGVFAAGAAALWRARRVPVLLFLAALAAGVSFVAFVAWVFHPYGVETNRWLLLVLVLAYLAGHAVLRERRRREAVLLVDAAGLAAAGLAVTLVGATLVSLVGLGDSGSSAPSIPAGWELVVLMCGFGLVAFAAVERESGPGFLGVLVLGLFAVLAGRPGAGGASVLWWPLILLALGVGAIAAGLRPARPLPPEPEPLGGPADTVPLRPKDRRG